MQVHLISNTVISWSVFDVSFLFHLPETLLSDNNGWSARFAAIVLPLVMLPTAREEAVVEETQAEGRSYQDTLKQLRNTEKSQTKASKVS